MTCQHVEARGDGDESGVRRFSSGRMRWFSSAPHGFLIRLDYRPCAMIDRTMTTSSATPARILVIEDDAGIASVLQRGLSLYGWTVTVAPHGVAGRRAWQAGSYDLAIVDVMLPGVNGIDLLVERRAAGDRTPVILLTARDENEYRTRGNAAGADEYITKPFVYRELVSSVERLISRRHRKARNDDQ